MQFVVLSPVTGFNHCFGTGSCQNQGMRKYTWTVTEDHSNCFRTL